MVKLDVATNYLLGCLPLQEKELGLRGFLLEYGESVLLDEEESPSLLIL